MVTGLRKIQLRREATRGTAVVTAMDQLFGRMTLTPTLNLYMPDDEERNSLALLHRRSEVGQQAALKYEGSLTFEQVINLLAMGIQGATADAGTGLITTPTGGINTRDWTYEPTLTALMAPNSYTIQYGDNQQAYQCAFVMASELEFVYAMGEPVMVSAELFGRYPSKVSFGASPTILTLEDAISQKTKIYADTTWAGLGTTQISDTLIAATVRIPTGIGPTRYADGSLDFSGYTEQKWAAEVDLTFKHNTSGVAEYDKYAAVGGTLTFIRLETTGALIEGALNKLFRLDLALRYTEAPELFGDQDGENVVRLVGKTFQDPTAVRQFRALVRNSQTALA